MRDKQATIKCKQAQHFMQVVYGGGELLDCPDAPGKPTRVGGRPDFVFRASSGVLCALELSDIMPENLKKVTNFVDSQLQHEVRGQLTGTFMLDVIFNPDKVCQVNSEEIDSVAEKIRQVAPTMTVGQGRYILSPGYELFKLGDEGRILYVLPLLKGGFSPMKLPRRLKDFMRRRLHEEVTGAGGNPQGSIPCKFDEYAEHRRILILDISRTPLLWELHSSLIHGWLKQSKLQKLKLDELQIGDYKVYRGDGKQIPTGHKYENHYYRKYEPLWKRAEASE